jgi:hypothetical protein
MHLACINNMGRVAQVEVMGQGRVESFPYTLVLELRAGRELKVGSFLWVKKCKGLGQLRGPAQGVLAATVLRQCLGP